MRILVLISILSLFFSCQPIDVETDQLFFVRSAGAEIPVWVKGNIDSGTFIVLAPGWPGLGLLYQEHSGFQNLMDDYAVVFWDCRGVGASKGNPDKSTMTMDQFTDDLDLIIDVLVHRYGNPDIFLMGHSFGGLLGSTYLTVAERQAKITGWISLEAANNNPEVMNQIRLAVISYAQDRVDNSYWSNALAWAQTHPDFTLDNFLQYHKYASKAGIIKISEEQDYGSDLVNTIFLTPGGGIEQQLAMTYMEENFQFEYEYPYYLPLQEFDYITLPSLILKGNFSKGGMGDFLAEWEYNALGTPLADKSWIVFQDSGHSPYLSEPDLFSREVSFFIERYK